MSLRLFNERMKRGWTQKQSAKQLNISKASFSNIETGKRKPSLRLALDMQDLFCLPIQELLKDVACDPPRPQATSANSTL